MNDASYIFSFRRWPSTSAELTLGAVQLSLGKTDPPRSLIAFRIASLSFGNLYTGASDSESELSVSSSSLGSGIAST